MSDNQNNDTASKSTAGETGGRRPGRWYATPLMALVMALGVGAAGVATTQAFGHGDGSDGWRGGWRAHHAHNMEDPATMERNIERGIRHLAIEIDASPAQQAALIELATGAVKDLHGFREMMQGEAGELAKLLTQPTVDRAAIEAFRTEKIEKIDQLTSRLVDVAAEAGEILTEEQRVKVAKMVAERRGKRRGWRH